MENEVQTREVIDKVLSEEGLKNFIKVFEKEHNIFRGTHDKMAVPPVIKENYYTTEYLNQRLWEVDGDNIYYDDGWVGIGKKPTVPLDVLGACKIDGGGLIGSFVVNSSNKYIDIRKIANGGTNHTATLTEGSYTGEELAAEIETQLEATSGTSYWFTITYSAVTGKFTLEGQYDYNIRWKTGDHGSDNADDHVGTLIGFDDSEDDTGEDTYTSDEGVFLATTFEVVGDTKLGGNVEVLSGYLGIKNNNELRFYDNGNYVGFEAPALDANQIWVLPSVDGPANEVLGTDNAGNLIWLNHDEIASFVLAEHLPLPNTLANVLTDHNKIAHDVLGLSHDSLVDISIDDHHPQSHTLASHSTKAHAELTGVTSDLHHAQLHASEHHIGGGDLLDHDLLDGYLAAEHKSLPNTIAQVLSDHTKEVHDALGLDHGALSGKGDDDHAHYHNDERGDARYYTKTLLDAGQLDTRYYTEGEIDTLLAAQDAFLELLDTPGSYAGQAGKFVKVNATPDGLEFADIAAEDEKVAVDDVATPGYLGALSSDGVLRVNAPLTYVDGGNFITLDIDEALIDHALLGGVLTDQHHAQLHATEHQADGDDPLNNLLLSASPWIKWQSGTLLLQTDEGDNTNTYLDIKGKGTGTGQLRLFDQDDAEYMRITTSNQYGIIEVKGTAPGGLHLQYTQPQNIYLWAGIGSGNPAFYLYGHKIGDAIKYGMLQVGSDGYFKIAGQIATSFLAGGSTIAYVESIGMRLRDGYVYSFGDNRDYSFGYDDGTDTLQVVDGFTLNSNIRAKLTAGALWEFYSKVGIGGTPSYRFHVQETAQVITAVIENSAATGALMTAPQLKLKGTGVTDAHLDVDRGHTGRMSIVTHSTIGSIDWVIGMYYNGGSPQSNYGIGTGKNAADQKIIVTTDGKVGIGKIPTEKLDVDGNLKLGASPYVKWASGVLILETDEADTNTSVHIRGAGTGYAIANIYDQDNAEYLQFSCAGGIGYIRTRGTSAAGLSLQYAEPQNIICWQGITSGNPYLYQHGYQTGVGVKYLRTGVLSSGNAVIDSEEVGLLRQGGVSVLSWAGNYIKFYDNKFITYGAGADYSQGYHEPTDSFQIVEGSTLNSNIRIKLMPDNGRIYLSNMSYYIDSSWLVAHNKIKDSDRWNGYQMPEMVADKFLTWAGGETLGWADVHKLVASGFTLDALVANNRVPDSDKLDGYQPASAATVDTIALRNASGYLFATYFNMTNEAHSSAAVTHYLVENDNDNYLRWCEPADFVTQLAADGLMPKSGGVFTGNIELPDHGAGTLPQAVNVIYGTGNPPAASSVPIGTIYIKYI